MGGNEHVSGGSKPFNAMEIFWFGSGFLFVLTGHEIQGYTLFFLSRELPSQDAEIQI